MMKMCRLFCFLILLPFVPKPSFAQTLSDSSLRESLTRAVQYWQAGKAKEAYITLDTITGQPLTGENAGTKVKAALWTANYLQAQYKVKSASPFLDSALKWAEQYAPGEELARTYDAYAAWHITAGNPKTALVAKEAAFKIRDSLKSADLQHSIDSLNTVITTIRQEQADLVQEKNSATDSVSSEAAGLKKWIYILGGICALLLVIVFMMNGNLQRLRNSPPAPAPSAPRVRPEPAPARTEPAAAATPAPAPVEPIVKPAPAPAMPKSDIVIRLQEVELVLIRAESLGSFHNGETKAIRNFLNEYMAQLPFIMKTLDEAITKNESAPILNSLEHLKPYLQTFGMSGTLKLITEIETEAATEKVSKLLSRVFQVRNHCRRAADEAKAILEKM